MKKIIKIIYTTHFASLKTTMSVLLQTHITHTPMVASNEELSCFLFSVVFLFVFFALDSMCLCFSKRVCFCWSVYRVWMEVSKREVTELWFWR